MHGVPGSCRLLLHFILVLCCWEMATEGLPTYRQEHGAVKDVVFGKDFVAILLDSPAQQDLIDVPSPSGSEKPDLNTFFKLVPEHIRQARSSMSGSFPHTPSPNTAETALETTQAGDHFISSTPKSDKVVVLAVSVSTSTGDSHRVRKSEINLNNVEDSTIDFLGDKAVIQSEFRPSIVAKSGKSDFSVEESEPITHEGTQTSDDDKEYPARVQPIPSPQALPLISSNSDLYQGFKGEEEKGNLSPYHHQTLIFHDSPHEPDKARSVSYASVIQGLPKEHSKQWEPNADHDRQDRHYDSDTNFRGNNYYSENNQKDTQIVDNSKTSKTEHDGNNDQNNPNVTPQKEWEGLQEQNSETSTGQTQWATTKNSYDENNRPQENKAPNHQEQRIYGQPEQNYEIEESVSVLSNGRVHGVQPIPTAQSTPSVGDSTTSKSTSSKPGDNQKVGYVVEGRNYRKYRVEERTPDGFIVGEYGVVSHNDGSLRGVRYTADGTINPRLIYDALMKFLSL